MRTSNLFKAISKLVALGLFSLLPAPAFAQQTPAQSIEVAKSVIEQAIKAGAESEAADDVEAAKAWLLQATTANSFVNNLVSLVVQPEVKKSREEEIIYFATMAKLKALTAEAKTKRASTATAMKRVQKELDDFQGAIAITKAKQEEADKARGDLARANAALNELEAKRAQDIKSRQDEGDKLRAELAKAQSTIKELEAKQIMDAKGKCLALDFKEATDGYTNCISKLAP